MGFALNDCLAVLVGPNRRERKHGFVLADMANRSGQSNGIPDVHGFDEAQRLIEVDGARSRQVHEDTRGDQRRAQEALRDAALEPRPRRERLVHVQGVSIPRELTLDSCQSGAKFHF